VTQEELLLYEIEKRNGSITTYDLMDLHISQYQARLKGLREKLALKGEILTEGIKLEGYRRNFIYHLIKPKQQQIEMFAA